MHEMRIIDAAEKLGLSQSTLSAIENGVKSTTLDNIEKMADLYGVTADFLLGRSQYTIPRTEEPVSPDILPSLHGQPVWSEKYGWMLVDAIAKKLIINSETSMTFQDIDDIYAVAPKWSITAIPTEAPVSKARLSRYREVWVEPISTDAKLRDELRGWYRIKDRYAENEFGNRFYFDTYGAKWIAFKNLY